MRIAQILLPGASEYERKSQRLDAVALSARHEIVMVDTTDGIAAVNAQVAHVYGPEELPVAPFLRFPLPYLACGQFRERRFALRRPVEPRLVVGPVARDGVELLPEAVEERFFASGETTDLAARPPRNLKTVGTFVGRRPGVAEQLELATLRLQRFRDDVVWRTFDAAPLPEDFASLDAWIDPASGESDYDGFVAEALVFGLPVVAGRTPLNAQRLEKGRCGWLVPPGDPNELVHAILAALFKPEVAEERTAAARQTASKFRPRQRLRVLAQMYETLTK